MKLPNPYASDMYNVCVGCDTAVFPGEQVHSTPLGYARVTDPPYGKQAVICTRCGDAMTAALAAIPTGHVYSRNCARCLNPNSTRGQHVVRCYTLELTPVEESI